MTKNRGIKAADSLMRKLMQVPKSELPAVQEAEGCKEKAKIT